MTILPSPSILGNGLPSRVDRFQGVRSPAGGQFRVESDGNGTVSVLCWGDRTDDTAATLDCANYVWVTDDGNPNTVGTSVAGSAEGATFGPIPVGRTGADADPQVITNDLPGDDDSTTAASARPPSICTYAALAASCVAGETVGVVTVNENDLPTVTPTNSAPPPACTGVDNTCPGATIRTQEDPDNPTIDVDLGITGVTLDNITSETCVQVNSAC